LFEEDTGHLLVEVELPGVPREDIGLELDEDDEDGSMSLTIAALKPQRPKEESGTTQDTTQPTTRHTMLMGGVASVRGAGGVSHPGEALRPLLSDRAAALQGRTRPHPGAHQRRGTSRPPPPPRVCRVVSLAVSMDRSRAHTIAVRCCTCT
jgi:hypothetical protein